MKIEFIKEEKLNGDVFYYTHVNGNYVDGSLSYNEEKAKNIFDLIVKTNNISPAKTVIAEVTIEL